MRELIRSRGLPVNSQKPHFLRPEVLRARVIAGIAAKSAFSMDGRSVRVGTNCIRVACGGRERELWLPDANAIVTVAWGPDREQIQIGVLVDHELARAYNMRAGLLLQDVSFTPKAR